MIAEYFSNVKRKLSRHILKNFVKTLPEKCPNTEYLSVFGPNAGKDGPEKTPYLDTFHAVQVTKQCPFTSKSYNKINLTTCYMMKLCS